MSLKEHYKTWFLAVKHELLSTEPQNIKARALCAQRVINECVRDLNDKLHLPNIPPANHYICHVQIDEHLQFLHSWPGLRININKPSKIPASKKEYMKKSKNWLNGRRAPNYGRTLFPFFIKDAISYLELVCDHMFGNNDESNISNSNSSSNTRKNLYFRSAIYQILATLCASCVALHEQAKKSPFFCKNSLERKGKLRDLLQEYAGDHMYVQGFPSCFKAAVDYFENRSKSYIKQYMLLFLLNDRVHMLDGDKCNVHHDLSEIMMNNSCIQQLQSTIRDLQSKVIFWQKKAQMLTIQLEERDNKIDGQQMQQMFNMPTTSLCSTVSLVSPPTSLHVSATSSLCSTPALYAVNNGMAHGNQVSHLPMDTDCNISGNAVRYDHNVCSLYFTQIQNDANAENHQNLQITESNGMQQYFENIPHLAGEQVLDFLDTHDSNEHANEFIPNPPTLNCMSSMNHSFLIDYLPSPMIAESPVVEHNDQNGFFQFSADYQVESPSIMNNFVFNQNLDTGGNSQVFSY